MALTEEQRQSIRDEEYFRAQVRADLAQRKKPGFAQRLSDFFETKAGFWLLTTVLAGLVATGLTSLQRYLDREVIESRERAERARRDTDTMLKLGPLLTSEKRSEVDMAIVLLDGLASDQAVEGRVANQVKALVQSTLTAGLKQGATQEEKAQATAIIAYVDRARVDAIQRPGADPAGASGQVAPSQLTSAIDNSALPVRVYIQIGSELDRPAAVAVVQAFTREGLVVPGIELVAARNAPRSHSVRYCDGKVDQAGLERVKAAIARAVSPAPEWVVLDPKLCGKVRFNHFELWFARRQEP